MGVTLEIAIDVNPTEYKLDEIQLLTSDDQYIVRKESLINHKAGDIITWAKLQKVWYDIHVKRTGGEPYIKKGFYLNEDTTLKLSTIINGKLPSPY